MYCSRRGYLGQKICKKCLEIPRHQLIAAQANRDAIDCMYRFLHQSIIPEKNIETMKSFLAIPNPKTREMADIIIQVAQLHPGRRNRWLKLAKTHRNLLERMLTNDYFDAFIDETAADGRWPDLYTDEEF